MTGHNEDDYVHTIKKGSTQSLIEWNLQQKKLEVNEEVKTKLE